jgi:hypothetical protein
MLARTGPARNSVQPLCSLRITHSFPRRRHSIPLEISHLRTLFYPEGYRRAIATAGVPSNSEAQAKVRGSVVPLCDFGAPTFRPSNSFRTLRLRALFARRIRTCKSVSKQTTSTLFRMNTYKPSFVTHKTKNFNLPAMSTYTIVRSNPFRMNTCEKQGEGGVIVN